MRPSGDYQTRLFAVLERRDDHYCNLADRKPDALASAVVQSSWLTSCREPYLAHATSFVNLVSDTHATLQVDTDSASHCGSGYGGLSHEVTFLELGPRGFRDVLTLSPAASSRGGVWRSTMSFEGPAPKAIRLKTSGWECDGHEVYAMSGDLESCAKRRFARETLFVYKDGQYDP
jgi:hypothetical protein